jgi:hypothetical protein
MLAQAALGARQPEDQDDREQDRRDEHFREVAVRIAASVWLAP